MNPSGLAAHAVTRMRKVWSSARSCRLICSLNVSAWLASVAVTRAVFSARWARIARVVPIHVSAIRQAAAMKMPAAAARCLSGFMIQAENRVGTIGRCEPNDS